MAEEILRIAPDQVKKLAKEGKLQIVKPAQVDRSLTAGDLIAFSERLFGQDFLGPNAVENTFDVKMDPDQIPAIPFSRETLEKAKDQGDILILRVPRTKDGTPLTMKKMQETLQGHFDSTGKGKVLYNTTWYKDEDFFKKETPQGGWALVSRNVLPETTNKNYLEQTAVLADYLMDTIPQGTEIHRFFQDAVDEFKSQQNSIASILDSNRSAASLKLVSLRVNQLMRSTAPEALYDLLVYFQNTGERLLPDIWTWTRTRTSDGNLVSVGGWASDGLLVDGDSPDYSGSRLGVCPSR